MTTALWKPEHVSFQVGIREKLARGPLPPRYDCGVCEAFGFEYWSVAVPNRDDPRWVAYAYHEVPKALMRLRDQQFNFITFGRNVNDQRAAIFAIIVTATAQC